MRVSVDYRYFIKYTLVQITSNFNISESTEYIVAIKVLEWISADASLKSVYFLYSIHKKVKVNALSSL